MGKIKGDKYIHEVAGLMCSDLTESTGNPYSLVVYISLTLFQPNEEMH
jgi:hypothetical protein